MEVNSTLIAKSGQSPLIVHWSDTRPELVVEFMELVNSQRSPAPLQWSSNPFTGLKSFKLTHVRIRDEGPTIQQILDILACSPALETLGLETTELVPTPIDTYSPKLRLSLLKFLSFCSISAITVEQIFDRIAVDPDIVTHIDIYPLPDEENSNASRFLTETLPPFAPVFSRLNKHYDGSMLSNLLSGDFIWGSKNRRGHYFRVGFRGIGIQAFFPWVEQTVGIEDPGVLLHLDLSVFTVENRGMFSTFERSKIVSEMEVNTAFNSASRDAMLDAVSRIEEAGDGRPGMVPSFPSLHTIRLDNWTGSLDGIERALRKRFAKRAMMQVRLPDLLVKISYFSVRNANDSKGILFYDNTHRIREIDGVRDFRIEDVVKGKERYAGILAVVWCEASSRVVWG
ncbi:hypothetical protein FS837_010317 [Tulasnella sp. UAMH 9824]|nr:hypothetical protein FS837_010317 [Tulasnella sp. UAMH 9824]